MGPLSCRAADSVKGFSDDEPLKQYNSTMASMVRVNMTTPRLAGGPQQVKALVAKPDQLGSTSGPTVEGQDQFLQDVLWPPV